MKLWIARDKNDNISLFQYKPIKGEEMFISQGDDMFGTELDLQDLDGEFDNISWNNSPVEIEIKFLKDEKGI